MDSTERIGEYVALLTEITRRGFEEATAVRILAEVAKDRRMNAMREERQNGHGNGARDSSGNGFSPADGYGANGASGNGEVPATAKQLAYLKSLGGSVTPGMTKAEASAQIDALNGGV